MGYFKRKIGAKNFEKIAQSGHTDCFPNFGFHLKVLGEISATQLGRTLTHEHLSMQFEVCFVPAAAAGEDRQRVERLEGRKSRLDPAVPVSHSAWDEDIVKGPHQCDQILE